MAKMSREELGAIGQEMAKKIIKKSGRMDSFCQLDWLIRRKDGSWYSMEVKHQEYYTAPPFDGHGLPEWQVKTRMRLFEEHGIRPMLLVFDINTRQIYWQWLDLLEAGTYHDTNPNPYRGRRVYPLTAFRVLGYYDEKYNPIINNGDEY